MSTLTVTTINTANGTTDLTIGSGNTTAGKIVVASNGTGLTFLTNSSYIAMSINSSSVSYNTSVSFTSFNNTTNTFTVGTTGYFVANGNVGIGNSTPTHKLRVEGTISDSLDNIRSIPVAAQTAAYVLASTDNGKTISTNANITVNGALLTANQIFTVFNNSSANISIVAGTGATVYVAGTANTGNTTLAQRGVATILCVAANTFVISGAGLS